MTELVFISYSRADSAYVEKLAAHLEAGAVPIWYDRELATGERFDQVIQRKIDECTAIVVVLTPRAVESKWVNMEIAYADDNDKQILPVLLAPCRKPMRIANLQHEDVVGGRMPRAEFLLRLRVLVDTVRAQSGTAVTAAQSPGTATRLEVSARTEGGRGFLKIYDSDEEEPPFASWSYLVGRDVDWSRFSRHNVEGSGVPALAFTSRQREAVGINKSLPTVRGTLQFQYKIDHPEGSTRCVYFAMIPMEETGPGRRGLIEVGGEVQGDPRNARSLYRQRHFAPRNHYGDGRWHSHHLDFDFSNVERAFYSIFAPRINEGVDEPGDATVLVSTIVAWAPR